MLALRTLTDGYLPRLTPFLEGDEAHAIFGNAPTILGVHVELLERLEAARAQRALHLEVCAIGAAFASILPFLKLYSVYCANYVAALEALEKGRSERPQLAAAIQKAEERIATRARAATATARPRLHTRPPSPAVARRRPPPPATARHRPRCCIGSLADKRWAPDGVTAGAYACACLPPPCCACLPPSCLPPHAARACLLRAAHRPTGRG